MYVLYDIAKEKFLLDQSGSVRYFLTKADVSRWIKDFAGEDWHEGVLGIVAGRILKETGKPTIVLSINENNQAYLHANPLQQSHEHNSRDLFFL